MESSINTIVHTVTTGNYAQHAIHAHHVYVRGETVNISEITDLREQKAQIKNKEMFYLVADLAFAVLVSCQRLFITG